MSEHVDGFYRHGLRRMTGRSTTEADRVASPLELIFDLVFAAAFGVLGAQLAAGIAAGHGGSAAGAFAFGGVAIVWAWINYSWFASAFDTDDWLFRLLTMVQMSGVIVLAIGLPQMFASVEHGGAFANQTMVAGYIVMRVALVAQWLRAARAPKYRKVARTYALAVLIAQIGWTVLAWTPLTIWWALAFALVLWVIELAGPIVAEYAGGRHGGGSTPWHAHHIAERYSLLVIITLGETVIGTIAAAQEITAEEGWTADSVVVIGAGIAMTFALWWSYFLVPSAPVLAAHRDRAFVWGYGHAFVFLSIAAVGASLHLIGYVYDPEVALSTVTVISWIAGSVLAFGVSIYLLDTWLIREFTFNPLVQSLTMGLPVVAIVLAVLGLPLWVCLLVVLAGPVTIVCSYELGGWRGIDRQLRRAVGAGAQA
ncbi:low temperature requirement protein A [Microbacterium gorillae]|uniref:low temperature requirement protein A n=1 Tax=Microbacterium gorillae TaxID=1231063 RepID=UPI000591014B|nr:low temperature requirement protein A [Microbacterium gorillae]